MKLPKSILVNELDLPETALEDKIVDKTRWATVHQIVFGYKDRFYTTTYRVGSTEEQDESPWQYQDEVDCDEVELKEVTVQKWVKME